MFQCIILVNPHTTKLPKLNEKMVRKIWKHVEILGNMKKNHNNGLVYR
jgi:hypothetical protein